MSKVVVAYDFSGFADRALQLAIEGGIFRGATIELLHVVDERVYERLHMPLPKADEVHGQLRDAFIRAREQAGKATVPEPSYLVRYGALVPEIQKACSEADGVFLGGQGTGAFGELILGRTAQRALRAQAKPTYIVKQLTAPANGILCAVDFRTGSRLALRHAAQLAERLSRPLTLCFVLDIPVVPYAPMSPSRPMYQDTLQRATEELAAFEESVLGGRVAEKHVVCFGGRTRRIVETVKENGIGLIVVGSHGHVLPGRVVLGSVTEQLAARSPVDVLVAR